jgi:hypothetical protein
MKRHRAILGPPSTSLSTLARSTARRRFRGAARGGGAVQTSVADVIRLARIGVLDTRGAKSDPRFVKCVVVRPS